MTLPPFAMTPPRQARAGFLRLRQDRMRMARNFKLPSMLRYFFRKLENFNLSGT
jgi:hypothetical protein